MFSVSQLLDSAKEKGNIESDYRLAKVIGITQSAVSSYRMKKSMPDARVLEQLCALSGDDVAVVMAEVQAARERTPEGRNMWLLVAKRLAGGASTAILSVLFVLGFSGLPSSPPTVAGDQAPQTARVNFLYIVSIALLSVADFARRRVRWFTVLFWGLSRG
jgi:hypothetical protein